MTTSATNTSDVTFIQYDIPPLKPGEYTFTTTQTIGIAGEAVQPNTFTASKQFAVPGNRFQLNGDDIVSVFPAPLSNGEFNGVMPLAVLRRDTLPWQRFSVPGDASTPWLALLLLEGDEAPPVQATTAAAVFPAKATITVAGSGVQGTGAMPAGMVSYPGLDPLDYGQSPADPCNIIDLPAEVYARVCPSAADLAYLAHIRLTDTYDATDRDVLQERYAIVLGNRWPSPNTTACVYLVSLENMGQLLPNDDGTLPSNWPEAASTVRLICYRTWSFFANTMDETFEALCEHLNRDAENTLGLTSVRLPAATPDTAAVDAALAHQAEGSLSEVDADVLVQDAFCMGYTALTHQLREAGQTVSWYRGPLLPYPAAAFKYTMAACPDALLRYDPQTGMFDTTFAQAWQLGELLALQSGSFSVSLYTWKQSLQKSGAAQSEMAEITQRMAGTFPSFFAKRSAKLSEEPEVPADIAEWIGRLKLLKGVPFAALVPDEAMVPVESLRFFHLDQDWVAALIDGAFSIGRAGSAAAARDAAPLTQARSAARGSARRQRKNQRPNLAALQTESGDADFEVITGCLLRSQLVSGWPGLNVSGYEDADVTIELPKLRMERLSSDLLICLFEGTVQTLTISEAPEQLHCGVEKAVNGYTTTLRAVTGSTRGEQYLDVDGVPVTVAVSVRPDGQTLNTAATAKAIEAKLETDFNAVEEEFTSAEFALEMVKGVVKVEYKSA